MVNDNDVLLVASTDPVVPRLGNIESSWRREAAAANLAEVGAVEPFSVLSLFAAGPQELARYGAGADILDDDRMRLEFSAPRELRSSSASDIDASFAAITETEQLPELVRTRKAGATALEWRHRAEMMARSDAYSIAYDDYVNALRLDPLDPQALAGFTRTATLTSRAQDALSWIKSLTMGRSSAEVQIATSKLLAAAGFKSEAVETAKSACAAQPVSAAACEQLAALHADAEDQTQLQAVVETLRTTAPDAAGTRYYEAVLAFLKGDAHAALDSAQRAITADPSYAAAYDIAGAAHTRLGQADAAARAFETSLRFDPHDSTAYTNLGLLALAAGRKDEARNYFAEALWLTPDSAAARDGLRQSSD
jgi:tetratricopeptide (TPR) repeat protein